MSSRIAPAFSKFTRTLSTSSAVARPSHLLTAASNAAVRKPSASILKEDAESTRAHSTSPSRPTLPTSPHSQPHPFRFMQTFHHSAPRPALAHHTVDSLILPDLFAMDPNFDPYSSIRVPLLPDNISGPPSGLFAPESSDFVPEQAAKEVKIVAANPDSVALPEGGFVDGVELRFVYDMQPEQSSHQQYDEMGSGMIKDLWRGLVDDVMGSKKPTTA
ncbi:hypothetical protein QBC40DRAFT_282124 [Triangularia verruculosa]|uniref:Uncharacterized protein n=1 Tax=Triangularia verruculosa TaxID=2587418 RepID=A0AAN6XEX4_9PEZI|nr:hypothetical protein QBC40DRAFT_282124 [Triangularia verruculosa]